MQQPPQQPVTEFNLYPPKTPQTQNEVQEPLNSAAQIPKRAEETVNTQQQTPGGNVADDWTMLNAESSNGKFINSPELSMFTLCVESK